MCITNIHCVQQNYHRIPNDVAYHRARCEARFVVSCAFVNNTFHWCAKHSHETNIKIMHSVSRGQQLSKFPGCSATAKTTFNLKPVDQRGHI